MSSHLRATCSGRTGGPRLPSRGIAMKAIRGLLSMLLVLTLGGCWWGPGPGYDRGGYNQGGYNQGGYGHDGHDGRGGHDGHDGHDGYEHDDSQRRDR